VKVHGFEADAVLFDCDGVLVDSEPLSYRAWSTALAGHGFELSHAEFAQAVGGTETMVAQRFSPVTGVEPDSLENAARAIFESIASTAAGFPDTVRLIERCRAAGVPMAVATNGARWRLDALLVAVGLTDLIATSVASDEVAAPKPAPDLYIAAARLAGVEPARCVVIEDSPTGIRAAVGAGCRVVAVDRGMFDHDVLSAAHLIVPELER